MGVCKLGWGSTGSALKGGAVQPKFRICGRLPFEKGAETTAFLNLKLTFEDGCFYPNAIFGCV